MPLLATRDLTLEYPGPAGLVRVLDGVNLVLEAGQCLGVVGESGSGKSQLALALMGLLPASARLRGAIQFEGKELLGLAEVQWQRLRGQRMAMIFQDPMTSLNPHLSIGRQMSEMLEQHQGLSRASAMAEAERMLSAVKVSEARRRLAQYPHEFSGGMRQRVMIAMMLLAKPALLIADEATTALDVTVQARILALLAELQQDLGLTLLFISHDLDVIAAIADQVMVLYGGRVMESGSAARVLHTPAHPYTRALLQCRPRMQGWGSDALQVIAGVPPRPRPLQSGCPFAPRCAERLPVCSGENPPWVEAGTGQGSACHRNHLHGDEAA